MGSNSLGCILLLCTTTTTTRRGQNGETRNCNKLWISERFLSLSLFGTPIEKMEDLKSVQKRSPFFGAFAGGAKKRGPKSFLSPAKPAPPVGGAGMLASGSTRELTNESSARKCSKLPTHPTTHKNGSHLTKSRAGTSFSETFCKFIV